MLYYTDKYFLGLGEMCINLKNPKFHYACSEGGSYCAVIMGIQPSDTSTLVQILTVFNTVAVLQM